MITLEMDGTYTVHFDKMNNFGPVGTIDGDAVPVYVHKDSLSPEIGETWVCKLMVNNGPNGTNYFAILQDKVEEPDASEEAEMPEEQKTAEDAPDDIKFVPSEDVYMINEDMGIEEEFKIVVPRRRGGWARFVSYVGNNTIHTDLLKDGCYIAYASLDGRKISIIPNPAGDLYCNNGTIQMDRLDDMMMAYPRRIIGHSMECGVLTVQIIDWDD